MAGMRNCDRDCAGIECDPVTGRPCSASWLRAVVALAAERGVSSRFSEEKKVPRDGLADLALRGLLGGHALV